MCQAKTNAPHNNGDRLEVWGFTSMRWNSGFKPPPPPLSQASKAKLGNRALKAISPLASSKDRKCVRGTGLLSQQIQASCYNNKLICVSAAD